MTILITEPKYCIYLTTYYGNKLPMFYIGSSSIDKILNKKYHGSIRSKKYKDIWNREIKENPHLFKTKILRKFYSRKNTTYRERKIQIKLDVVKSSMYINMAIANHNGFFGMVVTGKDHPFYGKRHSEETKLKISKIKLGCTASSDSKEKMSRAGKGRVFTEEHKQKMSASQKGNLQPKVICPHCGLEGGNSGMKHYHFDKCKFKILGEFNAQ